MGACVYDEMFALGARGRRFSSTLTDM